MRDKMHRARYAVLLAAVATACAQQSQLTSLNGTWDFALAADAAAADRLAGFYQDGFQGGGFRPIVVPSNWALQGFEEPIYARTRQGGEGFYVLRFQAPANLTGKRVLLHFGGVWDSAEVWLNSAPLGRHDSGFTGFAYDVTPNLKAGAENRLAVRVRQSTKDSAFDTNDDWALGGIYRDVWLEAMPAATYIDRVETSTTFDAQFRDADLNLRVLVSGSRGFGGGGRGGAPAAGGRGGAGAPGAAGGPPAGGGRGGANAAPDSGYDLRAVLTGPDGKEVQRSVLAIPGHRGTARDTLLTMHVNAPQHWTAETPNLYRLTVELVQGGAITHARTLAVGFRQISTAGGVLRINGQAVKLRGVCRHDENPDVGRATRREDWLQDLRLMKAANINMVRTSHYPPAEGFIELCDEMGMYVLDEVPMGFGGGSGDDPSFMSSGLLRAQETIARDRNHPSVIVWDIGNENPFTALHLAMIRFVKGSDPTRPVLMPQRIEEFLPPEIDILAPHYRPPSALDQLAAHSSRPIITTEYTHAYAEDGFGGLAESWRALTQHPSGAGGAIWMWQDQGLTRTRTNANGQPEKYIQIVTDGWDGIVRADRTPQRDYWEARAVYAPVNLPADAVHFWPGQAQVRVPIRNDYDFTELSTVGVRWSLMADDRELAKGDAKVNAAPHSTGYLGLPIDAIKSVEPGVAYYAHLAFLRADGSQIVERAVELLADGPAPEPARSVPSQVRVRNGKTVAVTAGSASYEFDPATAQLISASAGTAKVVSGSRFTIWRPLGPNDVLTQRMQPNAVPDLNKYSVAVKSWKVTTEDSGVRIDAEAEHTVNEKNSFSVAYTYRVGRDGVLRMEYTVTPHVEFPWLPEIGMEFETAAGLDNLRWLGLGPLDAYPNERTAPILGVYAGRADSETAKGTKATRWAELTSAQGSGLRVEGAPYIRLEGRNLRVLTSLVGRSEKGRRPEAPEYRLDTGSSAVFQGGFSLIPIAKVKPK
jgi:beta-galactosidase